MRTPADVAKAWEHLRDETTDDRCERNLRNYKDLYVAGYWTLADFEHVVENILRHYAEAPRP